VGSAAPEFTAPGDQGEPTNLRKLVASNSVLLIFYPQDWGWVCRCEVLEFHRRRNDLDRIGVKLVGLSTNLVVSHGVWSEHLGLDFPLISDPPGHIAEAYGVLDTDEDSFNKGRAKRALILVDRELIVRFVWVTDNPWLEPDYDWVIAACTEALQRPGGDPGWQEL
jgi:peroxiredoxin